MVKSILTFIFAWIFSSIICSDLPSENLRDLEIYPTVPKNSSTENCGSLRLIHTALGASMGAVLSKEDRLKGAVSGGVSALVSTVAMEYLSGDIYKTSADLARNNPNMSPDEVKAKLMESLNTSQKWATLSGAVGAFFIGGDVNVGSEVSANALKNNCVPMLIAAGVVAYEAYQIHDVYQKHGYKAALKYLGVSIVVGATGGYALKVGGKVLKAAYPTLKAAFEGYIAGKPLLSMAYTAVVKRSDKAVDSGKKGFQNVSSKISSKLNLNRTGKKIVGEKSVSKGNSEVIVNNGRKFWEKTSSFNGKKVYERDKLIDLNRLDPTGRTNLHRMKEGLAPLCDKGNSIELHHMIQSEKSAIAVVTKDFHKKHTKIIHINSNKIPSGINRSKFAKWRSNFWKNKGKELSENG